MAGREFLPDFLELKIEELKRFNGIGETTVQGLKNLGFFTIGQLYDKYLNEQKFFYTKEYTEKVFRKDLVENLLKKYHESRGAAVAPVIEQAVEAVAQVPAAGEPAGEAVQIGAQIPAVAVEGEAQAAQAAHGEDDEVDLLAEIDRLTNDFNKLLKKIVRRN